MLRILVATTVSLVAFAANSLLARAALADGLIDPVSFTGLRLASGALGLWLIVRLTRPGSSSRQAGSWASAAALFITRL